VEVHRKGVHHLSRRQRQQATETQQSKNTQPNRRGKNTNNIVDINSFRKPLKNKVMLLPKNLAQEYYVECLEDPNTDIVFASGPAGTGKTLIACLAALKAFQEGQVSKIIITRPAVSVDEQHGFLPGSLIEKMQPWVLPILDYFYEYYTKKDILTMIENNELEISPLAYMRGRTFSDAFIICDEMQNATPSQMKMVLTRIGKNSKIVCTGDVTQHDRGYEDNGLKDIWSRFDNQPGIAFCKFTNGDVERHRIIETVLRMYDGH